MKLEKIIKNQRNDLVMIGDIRRCKNTSLCLDLEYKIIGLDSSSELCKIKMREGGTDHFWGLSMVGHDELIERREI